MKRSKLFLVLLGVMSGTFACVGPTGLHSGTVTVKTLGNDASGLTGYYVQDGYRTPFNDVLPFTFARNGITEIELRKTDPAATLTVAAQYDVPDDHFEVMSQAGPGRVGLRVRVHNGLVMEPIDFE